MEGRGKNTRNSTGTFKSLCFNHFIRLRRNCLGSVHRRVARLEKSLVKEEKATSGSDYWQARGCEAARAEGQGFASEKADFGAANIHSGTDLVGADWERRFAAALKKLSVASKLAPYCRSFFKFY